MIVKATFKGNETMHGQAYKVGVSYYLRVDGSTIRKINCGGGFFPYASLIAFMKEWDKIEIMNEND